MTTNRFFFIHLGNVTIIYSERPNICAASFVLRTGNSDLCNNSVNNNFVHKEMTPKIFY